MIRRAASAAVVLLCAGAIGLFAVPRAGAHALLARADPGDGASLSSSPSSVTLAFTEEPDPSLSRIDVLDTSGATHQKGDAIVAGDPRELRVALESLAKGVYTVSWRVVSRVDGHLTAGAYAFGVGVSPSQIERTGTAKGAATSAPGISGAEVAGRVLLYIGLLALIGGSWVYGFAFRGEGRGDSASPSGSRTFMLAGVVVAVVGLTVFAAAQAATAGAGLPELLDTPIGRALAGRAIGIAVAALAVVAGVLSAQRRRIAWDAAGVAAAAAVYVHVSSGHAAAGGLVVIKVLEQFVHITAVGIWMGGLAALLVGIRGVAPDERLRAVRRFSAIAAVMLLVVTGSGTTRAVQEVGSWGALWSTGYGRLVLAKVAGIGVLAGFGALNRYRNVKRAADEPSALQRVARIELVTAVAVLVVAGLLASLAPAKSAQSQSNAASSVTVEGQDFTGDVSVRLEITPGQAGVNAFTIEADVRRGRPVRAVTMRLSPADASIQRASVAFERADGGWVARGAAIAVPGRWRAIVKVDRGTDSVEIPLAFHTACPTADVQDADGLRLYTIDLGGRSVQAYVDPARAGNNEVHFTLFDDKGAELALSGTGTVTASKGEELVELDERKLSPGHVVAGGRFVPGTWTYDFLGKTKGGNAMNVCFEDEIR